MNARKFYRAEIVESSWAAPLPRKSLTKQEEKIKEARLDYRVGIKKAWDIYTQDNMIVKEANQALRSEIDQAFKSCLPNNGGDMSESEMRLYRKALIEAHMKCADKVAEIWDAFIKDMETGAHNYY